MFKAVVVLGQEKHKLIFFYLYSCYAVYQKKTDYNMVYFTRIDRRDGVDIGYNGTALEPLNRVGCVGKAGIDKNFTLEQLMLLAHEIGANIIVKSGKNAKWYLKRCNPSDIEASIQKQKWRNGTKRCTMWIITQLAQLPSVLI